MGRGSAGAGCSVVGRGQFQIVNVVPRQITTMYGASLAAGVFYQDGPHGFGCGGIEMSPTVPRPSFLDIYQTKIRFVRQSRQLQRLPRLLLGHFRRRELP
jgi:hypothetical protein